MPRRISGFEFVIREGSETRRVRLQGSGGLLGDGCLHIQDWTAEKVREVRERNLRLARWEMRVYGCVRERLGDHLPPSQRICKIAPDEIVACKVLREVSERP